MKAIISLTKVIRVSKSLSVLSVKSWEQTTVSQDSPGVHSQLSAPFANASLNRKHQGKFLLPKYPSQSYLNYASIHLWPAGISVSGQSPYSTSSRVSSVTGRMKLFVSEETFATSKSGLTSWLCSAVVLLIWQTWMKKVDTNSLKNNCISKICVKNINHVVHTCLLASLTP